MSSICCDGLSVSFKLHHERGASLKERFAEWSMGKRRRVPAKVTRFQALDDVSFSIAAGDRVGIIGRNGAGKSTLLKVLCGIYPPSTGEIRVDGRIAPLLEIGAGFHPEFTGRENIFLNGAILGRSRAEIREILDEVVSFAELEEFIDTPVKYYSTGMYMRLGFSLATAIHPDILILDEMFAGGDAVFIEKARLRMQQLISKANILIIVSHDMSLVAEMCDRVLWIDAGTLRSDGGIEVIDQYLAAG